MVHNNAIKKHSDVKITTTMGSNRGNTDGFSAIFLVGSQEGGYAVLLSQVLAYSVWKSDN